MYLTYQTPTFKNAPQDLTNEVRQLHEYQRGSNIPLVSQGLWQVYRGVVQFSTISLSGEESLLGWGQPSTFFGLWLTNLEVYQAVALSDVYLRWYSLSEIQTSPLLAQAMLTQMAKKLRQTERLLAIAAIRPVEDRLQELLVLMKQELGETVSQGTRISVRLTHQNLANAIGTTRVTITRLLGEFQRQGRINFDEDRHLVIL